MLEEQSVTHITESLAGGVLKVLAQIIETQNSLGVKTKLIFLERQDTPLESELERFFPDTQLINLHKTGLVGLIRLYFKMYNEKNKASIFHFHSSWAGATGRIFAITNRSTNTFYSPHGFAFLRRDIFGWQRATFRFIEKFLDIITRTTIIAYGENEFRESRKISKKEVRKIDHFIETTTLPELNRKGGSIRIATAGRIANAKRPDRFVNLAKKLNGLADFVWIGSGNESDYDFEGGAVSITGWINSEDVTRELINSDIFVLLSDWEGLPFSALEAMGVGLPVILWDFPGANFVINNGINGYVCPDETELLNRVRELISDEVLRKTLGKSARTKIIDEYSYLKFEERCRLLYEK